MRNKCLRLRAKDIWCSGRTVFAVERYFLARVVPSRHLIWVPHLLFPTSKACSVKTARFGWNFSLQGSRAPLGFSQRARHPILQNAGVWPFGVFYRTHSNAY